MTRSGSRRAKGANSAPILRQSSAVLSSIRVKVARSCMDFSSSTSGVRLRVADQLVIELNQLDVVGRRDALVGAVEALQVLGSRAHRRELVDVVGDALVVSRIGATDHEAGRDNEVGMKLHEAARDRSIAWPLDRCDP